MRLLAFLVCLAAAAAAPAQPVNDATSYNGPAIKDDRLTNLLHLPSFEVNTRAANGLTTIFSIHNHSDFDVNATVKYYNTAGSLRVEQLLQFQPRQTRTIDVRDVRGLTVQNGFARGRVEITQTSGGSRARQDLSGDYFYLNAAGNFATGDQLLRREDHCDSLMVRLLDFGSGAKLRLYSSKPQGDTVPTAMFTVFNEAGAEVDSGPIFLDEEVEVLNARQLTSVRFGTLEIEYLEGGGSLAVEYSAAGRLSVAMNATCTGAVVALETCTGRRCPRG